ncbi:MAG TPA: methionyl-tRNA formyltransferase [Gemmataceae bacterium]|nr:methionyl-tRNA formyltransferase [Gemmataceae bacterium]
MRLVMMGTGLFAEPTLETLLAGSHSVVGLVTQPDRTAGAERGSTRQTGRGMKTIAQEHGVPVLQPESINTPEGVAALQALQPDLLVVAAYGQILSRDVLAVPPHGGINVHASLLPKYRGAAPIAWAIYHGETQTGVTIIKMSVSLDAGDMLAQEAIDIGHDETAGEVEARLAPLGARLALQVIEQIQNGTVQGRKQDPSQVTKAPKLKKEHGLIDWNRSAEQVRNQIRSMQPWPTAYTFLHRQGQPPIRVIIYRMGSIVLLPSGPTHPSPGSMLSFKGNNSLFAATGENGALEIVELQPAGKRRMTAVDFLRGHRWQEGDRFGPEMP